MERAYQKAKRILGKITRTEEKQNCYIFYNDNVKYDGVIVIMKNSNRAMSMSEYIMRYGS